MIARDVIDRIRDIHPALKVVTLYSRAAGDSTFGAGVEWTAKRKDASKDLVEKAGIAFGTHVRLFQLLQVAQAVAPKEGDKIVDWTGATWHVRSIDYKLADTVHDCLCVKAVT